QVRLHALEGSFELIRRCAIRGLISLLSMDEVRSAAAGALGRIVAQRIDHELIAALESAVSHETWS
ncbi:MAG: hypothetical protein M3619_21190, partial [Myxococcota bacterium]|nr:hypothetical protein [Myxococcota bacterium]